MPENNLLKDVIYYFAFLTECGVNLMDNDMNLSRLVKEDLAASLHQSFVFTADSLIRSIEHLDDWESNHAQCDFTQSIKPFTVTALGSVNSIVPPFKSATDANNGHIKDTKEYREAFARMSTEEIKKRILGDLIQIFSHYELTGMEINHAVNNLPVFLFYYGKRRIPRC